MTDLSELLDSKMDERIMHAINDLDFDGFKSLISELLGGIGVKVTRMDVSEDAVFFEGVSDEGKYFVVASRLFDNASVESMRILKEMATKRNATPVLVVTCDLDSDEKNYAENQGISYADKPKLLMLLRKYDLAGKMMAELDRRILDQERTRYLPSGAQFDAFYNAAEEHLKQRRYRDALYNYDRALDIKPNNDIVWLRKANVFLAMGRYEDALVACKRASELRPGDSTTWYLMGLAYNQLGDFEKELKAYDTALKISPRMEAALLNKGATLFQLHRYDWALKVYDDMCNFFPKDAMAFNNRGIVLKAMGRHKEALESFDKASFLNRTYIDPAVNRALTLIDMGRVAEAIEAWKEALQIDRNRADIWYSLGLSQKAMGLLEDATRSFENAAMLDKGLTEAATERDELLAAAEMAKVAEEPIPLEAAEPSPRLIVEEMREEVTLPSDSSTFSDETAAEDAQEAPSCPQPEEIVEPVPHEVPVPPEKEPEPEPAPAESEPSLSQPEQLPEAPAEPEPSHELETESLPSEVPAPMVTEPASEPVSAVCVPSVSLSEPSLETKLSEQVVEQEVESASQAVLVQPVTEEVSEPAPAESEPSLSQPEQLPEVQAEPEASSELEAEPEPQATLAPLEAEPAPEPIHAVCEPSVSLSEPSLETQLSEQTVELETEPAPQSVSVLPEAPAEPEPEPVERELSAPTEEPSLETQPSEEASQLEAETASQEVPAPQVPETVLELTQAEPEPSPEPEAEPVPQEVPAPLETEIAAETAPVEGEPSLSFPEPATEVQPSEIASDAEAEKTEVQEIVPTPEVLAAEIAPETQATEVGVQVPEMAEALEIPDSAMTEELVPATEGSLVSAVGQEAAAPAEPCALVPADSEMGLTILEPTCSEIRKVEENTAVVPAEPACVPALRDDKCHLVIPEEKGLPALVDREISIVVQPEEVTPSVTASEGEVAIAHSAEASAVEQSTMTINAPSMPAESLIVPEPVIETPMEPEIPISDRELKAAMLLNILGENVRALEEINLYIRDKSESHDARHIKALILDDLGRMPECLEELKEAIHLDPKDEIALLDIESISRRLGRKEESMIILSSITASKEVRAREAANMLEAKRYDDILSKFYGPSTLDSLVTRMAVATSLMAKARYRDAYRVLKEVLLVHPTYPEALNNMGVCMRFMGEYAYDEPMHFMRLAVEADPNYGDAWNNIGATLFVLGEYEAAMEAIRKAITVDRRSDYLINLSKCQIMVGDIAGAKLSLTSALKYEETAEIDFALGLIAEKEGDMKWALKLYDSAIELFPNFKDAIFNRQRVKLFLKYTQK